MINFHQRIKTLEIATQQTHVCTSCGTGKRIPRRIIRATSSGPLDRCQTCDGFVDEKRLACWEPLRSRASRRSVVPASTKNTKVVRRRKVKRT
jgi:hypothetical protein